MLHPPSLSDDVKARAFCARNGELAVLPADATAFLAACRSDRVQLLGWELWIVDEATGSWSGGIPVRGSDVPAVISGDGNVDEVERQLASEDLNEEVLPEALPFVRVNFTLDT